ncbi:hypothetical protein [Chryseobacterium luquanense]|uniref:Uncharacterized protein n=1 Tax=Chryseobacterium luquanense TaxID=2983766 RepID=A0ABT3Y929_9FLAO|nr:hypothetical protein [Chryseobacterium luquanense]MCX8534588.1 hypothetical protein [Chryseobacterium luquanense]
MKTFLHPCDRLSEDSKSLSHPGNEFSGSSESSPHSAGHFLVGTFTYKQ